MIRFALIVASTLGFVLTAAMGNLMVPLLRAFQSRQQPTRPPEPERPDAAPGQDPDEAPEQLRRSLGVVFQSSVLDQALTVQDHLRSRAALYGWRFS